MTFEEMSKKQAKINRTIFRFFLKIVKWVGIGLAGLFILAFIIAIFSDSEEEKLAKMTPQEQAIYKIEKAERETKEEEERKKREEEKQAEEKEHAEYLGLGGGADSTSACFYAYEVAKKYVNFPETIKHSMLYSDCDAREYLHADHLRYGWKVYDTVTAKNAYGVPVKSRYRIWVYYNGGDQSDYSNWQYITEPIFEEIR